MKKQQLGNNFVIFGNEAGRSNHITFCRTIHKGNESNAQRAGYMQAFQSVTNWHDETQGLKMRINP